MFVGKGWTTVAALQVGDAVQQADGTPGRVDAVMIEQRPQVMYNLTVATAHTYFVGEGEWLVHNACGGSLGEAVEGYAGTFQNLSQRKKPGTVAVLETQSGNHYSGRSGFREAVDSRLTASLNNVPEGQQRGWHGRCAEIHCMTQALNAGDSIDGAKIATASVADAKRFGQSNPPCTSCSPVLRDMGVEFVDR